MLKLFLYHREFSWLLRKNFILIWAETHSLFCMKTFYWIEPLILMVKSNYLSIIYVNIKGGKSFWVSPWHLFFFKENILYFKKKPPKGYKLLNPHLKNAVPSEGEHTPTHKNQQHELHNPQYYGQSYIIVGNKLNTTNTQTSNKTSNLSQSSCLKKKKKNWTLSKSQSNKRLGALLVLLYNFNYLNTILTNGNILFCCWLFFFNEQTVF